MRISYYGRFRNTLHGPQTWPWWRLFSVAFVSWTPRHSGEVNHFRGGNIWLYTRWGVWHWQLKGRGV